MFALFRLLERRKLRRRSARKTKSRPMRIGLELLERRELLSATIAPLHAQVAISDPAHAFIYGVCERSNVASSAAVDLAATAAQPKVAPLGTPHTATVVGPLARLASPSEIDSGNPLAKAVKPPPSSVPSYTTKGKGYVYYHYGYTDVSRIPTPGLALEGGGTDVDQVYQWLGKGANGGDFLVLGTSGKDAYDSYIYGLNNPNRAYPGSSALNSVSTLVFTSSAAVTNPFVLTTIQNAEAIFIEGGDQSTYVNLWQGTPIQTAINTAVGRGDPIGGTSAGLAVLGQYIFSAENGTALSSTVLANPYDRTVTLDQGFLSLPTMANTITDSHFYERDRMGRLDTFLARLVTNPQWTPPSPLGPPAPAIGTKGIGIDEQTALLVDLTAGPAFGYAQVVGNPSTDPNARHAYFLETTGIPQTCLPKTPLTYDDSNGVDGVLVHRAALGDVFNLNTWTELPGGPGLVDYTLLAVNGVLSSTQSNGSIY